MSDPNHTGDCLFCRIVTGELPADEVRSNESAVAFRDTNPQAPTHVLVVPRSHHANAVELARQEPTGLAALVELADEVAEAEGLAGDYRLVFNTGPSSGQTVFHTHLHVLGGRPMNWPPG